MINPFALGHLINHPPPDTPANCLLLDFDLPYSFFPSAFTKFIPYINYRELEKDHGNFYRAVAVVSC